MTPEAASPEDDSPAASQDRTSAPRVAFGYREVAAEDKRGLVKGVFDSVAARYDLMNDLMSAGIHRLWKRALVEAIDPRPGARLLDLAGGTGDIARRAHARWRARGLEAVVCDINPRMLERGRERAWNQGVVKGLEWLCGDAEALPLRASSFDACTIGFGIRNVTSIAGALAEIARALKPGGRFLCLEFSPAVLPALRPAYDAFSFNVIPALGEMVTGDRAAYRYLVESIRRFPDPARFATMIEAAGFAGVGKRLFSGGIAALHSAFRV